jgi:hypothetical protein
MEAMRAGFPFRDVAVVLARLVDAAAKAIEVNRLYLRDFSPRRLLKL